MNPQTPTPKGAIVRCCYDAYGCQPAFVGATHHTVARFTKNPTRLRTTYNRSFRSWIVVKP